MNTYGSAQKRLVQLEIMPVNRYSVKEATRGDQHSKLNTQPERKQAVMIRVPASSILLPLAISCWDAEETQMLKREVDLLDMLRTPLMLSFTRDNAFIPTDYPTRKGAFAGRIHKRSRFGVIIVIDKTNSSLAYCAFRQCDEEFNHSPISTFVMFSVPSHVEIKSNKFFDRVSLCL
ncbi:hypothetical protein TELCIR_06074 [Teladorsagia circumcincta]|uniref:Uncharacterized protein n=1 Tax=Teladorsagia circumcincta TaxID=45464 RepID=A0A2G9UP13_TELCI|nr:hypothetical protein TELCIR_06074 [Teladorsagia circumcincta]